MGQKGFTLIEMLLVVAIIGFLVAILLPAVGGYGSDAKMKAARADLRTLKSALEVYYISHGAYPPDAGTGAWGDSDCFMMTSTVSGYYRFVDQFPEDAYGTSPAVYLYDLSTNGSYYIVSSVKDSTAAPVANDGDSVTPNGASLYVTNARTTN